MRLLFFKLFFCWLLTTKKIRIDVYVKVTVRASARSYSTYSTQLRVIWPSSSWFQNHLIKPLQQLQSFFSVNPVRPQSLNPCTACNWVRRSLTTFTTFIYSCEALRITLLNHQLVFWWWSFFHELTENRWKVRNVYEEVMLSRANHSPCSLKHIICAYISVTESHLALTVWFGLF